MSPATPSLPTQFPCWCRAIYSFGGESKQDLGFLKGDLIECLNAGDGSWWMGRLHRDRRIMGLFPSNFVEVLFEVSDADSQMVVGASSITVNDERNARPKSFEMEMRRSGSNTSLEKEQPNLENIGSKLWSEAFEDMHTYLDSRSQHQSQISWGDTGLNGDQNVQKAYKGSPNKISPIESEDSYIERMMERRSHVLHRNNLSPVYKDLLPVPALKEHNSRQQTLSIQRITGSIPSDDAFIPRLKSRRSAYELPPLTSPSSLSTSLSFFSSHLHSIHPSHIQIPNPTP